MNTSPSWFFGGLPIVEVPFGSIGFIYEIEYKDGSKYIGKKNFTLDRRLKPRKGDRVNAKRIKTVESNWKEYTGSTKLSKGKEIARKNILKLCGTKIDLTYWEIHYMVTRNVLFREEYLNQNVLGKFFAGKLEGSKPYVKSE